jgi:hypothetical protein
MTATEIWLIMIDRHYPDLIPDLAFLHVAMQDIKVDILKGYKPVDKKYNDAWERPEKFQ